MNKENLNLFALILFIFTSVLFVNNLFLTKKITEKVIDSLKREYVPGPYSPGFDPDKVPTIMPL